MKDRESILVTGGAGYIGSHTILEILRDGSYDVVSADNFSNGDANTFRRIAEISGKEVKNYNVDLTRAADTRRIFSENPQITAVIHFAALKSVPESVEKPELYFSNNVGSLEVLLGEMRTAGVNKLIFSSSCSVYGNSPVQPVTEETPLQKAESPYGATKLKCEEILRTYSAAHPEMKTAALRYFNPAGAHASGKTGEIQKRNVTGLVPILCAVAAGERKEIYIHGTDYPTRDGTCIRDYVHITDIARAHVLAHAWLNSSKSSAGMHVFNLGSGNGTTVEEAVNAFQKVNHLTLNVVRGPRRPGDVAAIYSNGEKAKRELGWQPELSLGEMMRSAWEWEKKYRSLQS
ncbi:MAG: UDP-glucose 4-epimerase GalE [Bacteroidia bacterium]|nr:UDP-glucose 4-epimerase GalE [Bacteroidia bacterium]